MRFPAGRRGFIPVTDLEQTGELTLPGKYLKASPLAKAVSRYACHRTPRRFALRLEPVRIGRGSTAIGTGVPAHIYSL
jgi:hypothetical protein